MKTKTEKFIEKAIQLHGERYSYGKVLYTKTNEPVIITCSAHGDFLQTPLSHLRGSGCTKCFRESQRIDTKTFIQKSVAVHGDLFDYTNTVYVSSNEKVKVACKLHGEFLQFPQDHMSGHGCPICANKNTYTTEQFIEKCKSIHGDKYDYTKSEYKKYDVKTIVTCRKHGDFEITPKNLFGGYGCYSCGRESAAISMRKSQFNNLYTIDESINHIDIESKYIKCLNEIKQFIESLEETVTVNATVDNIKVDILVENKNIAIDFDGLYSHSSGDIENDISTKKRHLEKTSICEENGIQLLHIFENEWDEKRDVWKSVIKNKLGKSSKVYARNTIVTEITTKSAKTFCDKNHMQGHVNGKYYYALVDNTTNETLALMVIGTPRYSQSDYEILRYCNKLDITVVGGFSKILKHFSKENKGKIVSYANRRWSNGKLYESTGFTKLRVSDPCYFYIKNNILHHRSRFMKHKLKDLLPEFDSKMSEVQNMYNSKYRRIWDCGNIVYEFTLT